MDADQFKEALKKMEEVFGSREEHLFWMVLHYAERGQAFDATFYDREPLLEVTLSQGFAYELTAALMYRAGTRRLADLLARVTFSDGTVVDLREIWTLNYMPPELDTNGVDVAQGEQIAGANGETIREMIRNTYHCKSRAEEDFFLRRWIAS
jgi:hypothetical protein